MGERVVGRAVLELLPGAGAVGDVEHARDRAADLAAGPRQRAEAQQRPAPGAARQRDVDLDVAVDALVEHLVERGVEAPHAVRRQCLQQRRDRRGTRATPRTGRGRLAVERLHVVGFGASIGSLP